MCVVFSTLSGDKTLRFMLDILGIRGWPFNSWGGGEWFLVIKNVFSSNLVGRMFFPFFSHKLSITFVLHAIFFFRQALAGNFFSKFTHPLPQELNGRPLTEKYLLISRVFGLYCKLRILVFFHLFMARVLRAWAINRWKKTRIRNLRYGPKKRGQ